MAIYNEILSPRYARLLQKLFAMKGPNPTKQLSGEIMAVLPLFLGAEGRFHEAWQRFGAVSSIAGVAAQFGTVQYRNPAGSNIIAVFEKLSVSTGTTGDFVAGFVGPKADEGSTPALTNNRFDPRGNPQPVLIRSLGNDAAVFAQNAMFGVEVALNQTADIIVTDIQEFPVLPGDSLVIQNQTANSLLRTIVFWRERFLEESERQ